MAQGPVERVLTSKKVSECFGVTVSVRQTAGRRTARAAVRGQGGATKWNAARRRAPVLGDYPPDKTCFSLQFVLSAIQVRGSLRLLVLLILVAVWALVLGPSLLRRRFERRSSDSIGSFHRQLRILGRTGPTLVDPAYRLGTQLPRRQ